MMKALNFPAIRVREEQTIIISRKTLLFFKTENIKYVLTRDVFFFNPESIKDTLVISCSKSFGGQIAFYELLEHFHYGFPSGRD